MRQNMSGLKRRRVLTSGPWMRSSLSLLHTRRSIEWLKLATMCPLCFVQRLMAGMSPLTIQPQLYRLITSISSSHTGTWRIIQPSVRGRAGSAYPRIYRFYEAAVLHEHRRVYFAQGVHNVSVAQQLKYKSGLARVSIKGSHSDVAIPIYIKAAMKGTHFTKTVKLRQDFL